MLAELRLTPVDSEVSFARLIADLVPILAESPLQYRVHAMGTTLEGGMDEILGVVRRCHEESRRHADRVLLELSIDDRAGADGEIVRSVEQVRDLQRGAPLERVLPGDERARLRSS
jgi:uncharacterized protein (TIGR00106 family)